MANAVSQSSFRFLLTHEELREVIVAVWDVAVSAKELGMFELGRCQNLHVSLDRVLCEDCQRRITYCE